VILKALPSTFPIPLLIVQHIAIGFAPGLAEWLDGLCGLRVKVAEHGERALPGQVLIAADDRHLGIGADLQVAVTSEPPVLGFRPSGNFLFSSAARVLGPAACAVVLTGMGTDGVEGLRELKAGGGRLIAQDEATSVVFGMPGAAVSAGLADQVLPLEEIAPALLRLAEVGGRASR
jgi:two-component system chemotaxis response regulator CheB